MLQLQVKAGFPCLAGTSHTLSSNPCNKYRGSDEAGYLQCGTS